MDGGQAVRYPFHTWRAHALLDTASPIKMYCVIRLTTRVHKAIGTFDSLFGELGNMLSSLKILQKSSAFQLRKATLIEGLSKATGSLSASQVLFS